jgi:hypothetical protein
MKKLLVFFTLIFTIFAEASLDDLLSGEDYSGLLTEETMETKEGHIKTLVGEAYLEYNESWLQLVEKDAITEGDTMITLDNTKVEVSMDNDIDVVIGEKSKVYFENMKGDIKKEELNDTNMQLVFGTVYSNIRRKLTSGGKFEISSGSVVAGVRGTRFKIRAFKNGRVMVKVFSGIVQIFDKRTGDMKDVKEKEFIILKTNGETEEFGTHDGSEENMDNFMEMDFGDLEEEILSIKDSIIDDDIIDDIKDRIKELGDGNVELTNSVIITVE